MARKILLPTLERLFLHKAKLGIHASPEDVEGAQKELRAVRALLLAYRHWALLDTEELQVDKYLKMERAARRVRNLSEKPSRRLPLPKVPKPFCPSDGTRLGKETCGCGNHPKVKR